MKRLIFDIDDTICFTANGDYQNSTPNLKVIEKIKEYKQAGFEICFSTSRNMRTYEGNVGKITAHTLPIIIDWLNRHNVPYDEVYVAKPWCGFDGFYVDDKAIRPDEFCNLSYEEICKLINR
ncbi:capsular biosynthesis protein [Acinetobacter rudis]|uniref:capsular biosynthesis protein n=1 Tax=Acinetobacter rudis TaxID=632955 RepID=UPI00333E787F